MKPTYPFRLRTLLVVATVVGSAQLVWTQDSGSTAPEGNPYYALIIDVQFGSGKYLGKREFGYTQQRTVVRDISSKNVLFTLRTWEQFWKPFNELYRDGFRLVQVYHEQRPDFISSEEVGAGGKFRYEGPAEVTTYVFEKH